jgi:hypothetical protein
MENTQIYKSIKNFLFKGEAEKILNWLDTIDHKGNDYNVHLQKLGEELNGNSYVFDISNNKLTNYISKFHSMTDVSYDKTPEFIENIIDRISKTFNFPCDNIFMQLVDMKKGGKIHPHYDASIDGYINYKCNICILSEDYNFYLDKTIIEVQQGDLYGFEASLYKHWTEEFKSRRVFLSVGFLLPYDILNRTENDPRVRLSQRIEKYFQNK